MTKAKPMNALAAVWLGGTALRLLLSPSPGASSTELLSTLSNEIGNPQTSLLSRKFTCTLCKRHYSHIVKECLFYYNNNLPLYSNSICHQPPLLIALFSLVPEHLYATLFIFVDTAIAALIALIYAHLWTPRNVTKDALNVVAAYYLNPLVVLTCVSHSITAINNLCLIACLFLALRQKHLLALFFLASATYLSLYPIILLPPILLILSRSTPFGAFSGIIIFAGWLIALFGLTFMQMTGSLPVEMLWSSVDGLNLQDAALAVVGNTGRFLHSLPVQNGWRLYQTFLNSMYGFILTIPDLTPNIGLYWYFFTEMFDASRPFFLYILQMHIFSLSIPLTIKFRSDPVFCFALLCGIVAVFKSYPTFGDFGFWLSAFLSLQKHLITYLRKPLICFASLGAGAVLLPIFRFIWIYSGSGNSNFYYAMTLVWSLGAVFLLLDLTYSWLRQDWDRAQSQTDLKDVDVQMQ